MISISTVTQNSDGNVILKYRNDLRNNVARLSRYTTLDGGSYQIHSGFSDGDRTLDISDARISKDDSEKLWTIFRNETSVLVSLEDGIFLAGIKVLRLNNGLVDSTIYIKSKENT